MGPGMMQPQAMWFARRGWVVAIVTRRGYGASGGNMDKTHYGCDEKAFATIAEEDAADLIAVFDTVKSLPQVDGTSVIATGNSAGGFAALAFGAHAPSALKAVINFSGAWHSLFFAGSCAKSGLIPEFHSLGAATHVPTLWLYAKNDSLFAPKSVSLMHDAFTDAGAEAEMPLIGKSGDDGHYLFSESLEIWSPLVEQFLKKHDLPWQDQARRLLAVPSADSAKDKRDHAILSLLLGCGLRRAELTGLRLSDFQQRDEHWAIVNLFGKGGPSELCRFPNG